MNKLIGYFDGSTQTKPAYDPGTNVVCLVCNKKLEKPIKTISICDFKKSFFFRTHKACWEKLSTKEQSDIESSIIDSAHV